LYHYSMQKSFKMQEINTELCCVCLETNTTLPKIQKWKCTHSFHASCIEGWNHSCPMCRTHTLSAANGMEISWTISRNPRNTLDIEFMKSVRCVPADLVDVYKRNWKDQDCIAQNHPMVYSHPSGVVVICEHCNTVQCFDL